jgi:hypothetical protein
MKFTAILMAMMVAFAALALTCPTGPTGPEGYSYVPPQYDPCVETTWVEGWAYRVGDSVTVSTASSCRSSPHSDNLTTYTSVRNGNLTNPLLVEGAGAWLSGCSYCGPSGWEPLASEIQRLRGELAQMRMASDVGPDAGRPASGPIGFTKNGIALCAEGDNPPVPCSMFFKTKK